MSSASGPYASQCQCQIVVGEFFSVLVPCPQFVGLMFEPTSADVAEVIGQLASCNVAWTQSLATACMSEVLEASSSREDLFRGDSTATRCLKAAVSASFAETALRLLLPVIAKELTRPKSAEDVATRAARLLKALLPARWPALVVAAARTVAAAADRKFPGSGTTALVGLFWLRMLCPLLLQQATSREPAPKPSRAARFLDCVKYLQSQANAAAATDENADASLISACLRTLLNEPSEPDRPSLPALSCVHRISHWVATNSLVIGRRLKSADASIMQPWSRLVLSIRELAMHYHETAVAASTSCPQLLHAGSWARLPEDRRPTRYVPLSEMGAWTSASTGALEVGGSQSSTHSQSSVSSSGSLTSRQLLKATPDTFVCSGSDRSRLPSSLRGMQLDRAQVEAWQPIDVELWLSANGLKDLVGPFCHQAQLNGGQLLALRRDSPIFAQFDVRLGRVKSFIRAQKSLARATLPVFDASQFSSPEEHVVALKEFICRLAHTLPS